jgi:beta-lactamase class A
MSYRIYCTVLFSIAPQILLHADDLHSALQPIIDNFRGSVAVGVKHLESGEQFGYRGDEPMPTASLIKLAVMIEAYQQAAEGRISLDARVTLADEEKVPGAGILTPHFSAGASFTLRDAVHLMIVYSDNTATNLVLDRIGLGSTSERMELWGFANTKIHSQVFRRETTLFPQRSQRFGLGSTTAWEMVGVLSELHSGARIRDEDRAAMLQHLKRCADSDKFTRFLPPRTVVAHKTGAVDRSRTDAGIIYTRRGPVAVCVLTTDNEDTTWRADNAGNLLCARIARIVFDHFEQELKELKQLK